MISSLSTIRTRHNKRFESDLQVAANLPALIRVAPIFSIASCTKFLPKRKLFAFCGCGHTMNDVTATKPNRIYPLNLIELNKYPEVV